MAEMTAEQLLEVRALLPDDIQPYAFSDQQLNAIFGGSGAGSIMRTVAWASFALGGGALLVDGIKNDEISTSTARSAAEWRLRATFFFGKADEETGGEDYFDLIDPFATSCHPELAPRPGYFPW